VVLALALARNEATEELGIEFSPEVADIRHIFDADFMGKRNRVVVSCYEVRGGGARLLRPGGAFASRHQRLHQLSRRFQYNAPEQGPGS
jgi:hypothetical protein